MSKKPVNRTNAPIWQRRYKEKNPWVRAYSRSKDRARSFGWFHTMTPSDFKELWFRDKAYDMKRPSIDRIDTSIKGYTKSNCQFLELSENCAKDNRGICRRPVKIQKSQYPEIYEKLKSGLSQKKVALEYGCSPSRIQAIKKICDLASIPTKTDNQ